MDEKRKHQYLLFRIGEESFALPIFQIREVTRYQPLQKVPRALPFVKGVIDLRGSEIVPIVDLADRLGLSPPSATDHSQGRFLIVQVEGRPVGIWVSQVEEVLEVSSEEIVGQPLGVETPFLGGVIRKKIPAREGKEGSDQETRLIFILKVEEIFTHKELVHLREIREQISRELSPSAKSHGSS